MSKYTKALDKNEWSEHYNIDILNSVVSQVRTNSVSIWSDELLKICEEGSRCLEIGCGSGLSSLWLAKHDRIVTALDYTESSVDLVNAAKEELELSNINVIQADATKDLPFKEKEFDYIFQAGLLEHFDTNEQIRLLANWKKYGRYMVSMIPNAASIPYRIGKQILEDNNEWEYGLEIPKHSLGEEFSRAGLSVIKEYTIGTEWALSFLPKKHYVRKFFEKMKKDGYSLDKYMQGYLLVTIGEEM